MVASMLGYKSETRIQKVYGILVFLAYKRFLYLIHLFLGCTLATLNLVLDNEYDIDIMIDARYVYGKPFQECNYSGCQQLIGF